MRASMAYLAGAGTIVVAIAIGLGGGLVAGNIMNPHQPKQGAETSKLERRASPVAQAAAADTADVAPRPATGSLNNAAAAPVPYAQATQRAGFVATSAPSGSTAQQDNAKTAEPTAEKTAAASTVAPELAAAPPSSASAQQPQQPKQAQQPSPPAASQPSKPEQAYAKASASDLKREARDRRRSERHEHWAQRHRRDWRERDYAGAREARSWRGRAEPDWGDVDRSIRDDDQRDYASSPRPYPQFRLFGED